MTKEDVLYCENCDKEIDDDDWIVTLDGDTWDVCDHCQPLIIKMDITDEVFSALKEKKITHSEAKNIVKFLLFTKKDILDIHTQLREKKITLNEIAKFPSEM